MYQPKYEITNSILNNIVKFESTKVKLGSKEMNSATSSSLEQRSKALNIMHLGHILGLDLTVKDSQKIADGKRIETEDPRGRILTNYRSVLEFTRSVVSESYAELDKTILLHINKILINDWKDSWESKFRNTGDNRDLSYEDWYEFSDQSVDDTRIEEEFEDLVNWYKLNLTSIHPIIRIGVAVYRLIRIMPMVAVNKITIIGLVDYMFYKNHYLQDSYLPVTRNFDVYDDEYRNALKYTKDDDDLTQWLEKFSKNLTNEIFELREAVSKKLDEEQQSRKQPFLDLNKRQLKILRYLQTIPTLKREDYVQMMNVSTMTAYRDLTDLVDKNLLRIDGNGRGTKYMLSSR